MATSIHPPSLSGDKAGVRAADVLGCWLSLVPSDSARASSDPFAAVVLRTAAGTLDVAGTPRFPCAEFKRIAEDPEWPSAREIALEQTPCVVAEIAREPAVWLVVPQGSASAARASLARAAYRLALLETSMRTERAFQAILLSAIGEGILTADGGGVITFLSDEAARILGVTASDAVGRRSTEVLRSPRADEDILAHGLDAPLDDVELAVITTGGRVVPLNLRMVPLRGESGASEGVLAVIRDLEPSKRLEEQARCRDRMTALGELTAAVAHEVRNPLTAVAASAQILRRRLQGEESQAALIGVILEETARLNRIVDSMLQYSWQPRPRLVRTDLAEIVGRLMTLVADLAAESGVRMAPDVAPDLPPVYADPDQIEQVLLNLVRNAIQSMPDGGALTLQLRSAAHAAPPRRLIGRRADDPFRAPEPGPVRAYVEISVSDTGAGIREEDLARVFDPFFTTRREGTGLGLSISQGIIEAHGGYLTLTSQVGAGTQATVGLPVERRQGERRFR